MAAFKKAAQLLKEKREEEKLPAEERVYRCAPRSFERTPFSPVVVQFSVVLAIWLCLF